MDSNWFATQEPLAEFMVPVTTVDNQPLYADTSKPKTKKKKQLHFKKKAIKTNKPVATKQFLEEKTSEDVERDAWKLFKSRNTLLFHLCYDCNGALYNDQDKFEKHDDETFVAKIRMCMNCALRNISMNTLYYFGFERHPSKQ